MAAQSELMQAQRENGLSLMGGIGCLPLLIQFPFFSALYYAARYTPGVLKDDFLWFNLGHRDFPLIIIIAALYYFQSWLSIQQVPEEQRKQIGGDYVQHANHDDFLWYQLTCSRNPLTG